MCRSWIQDSGRDSAVPIDCVETYVRHIPHHHLVHRRRLTAYVESDGVHAFFLCNPRDLPHLAVGCSLLSA